MSFWVYFFIYFFVYVFFFFKQKTAYEMRISDWSSDVCSSDLVMRQPSTLDSCMREMAWTERSAAPIVLLNRSRVSASQRNAVSVGARRSQSSRFSNSRSRSPRGWMRRESGLYVVRQTSQRSDERGVGKGCFSCCRSRW